jgi:hypothetical protein
MTQVFENHKDSAPVFPPAPHPARGILVHRLCHSTCPPPPHSLANSLFSAHRSLRHVQGPSNQMGFNMLVLDTHPHASQERPDTLGAGFLIS